jgi:hypothetical protein
MDGTGELHVKQNNSDSRKTKIACFPSYVESRFLKIMKEHFRTERGQVGGRDKSEHYQSTLYTCAKMS